MAIIADEQRHHTLCSAYRDAYTLTIEEAEARGVVLPDGVKREHENRPPMPWVRRDR
jgi:hypothetical protein